MSEKTRETNSQAPIHRKVFAWVWSLVEISSEETDKVDLSNTVYVPGHGGGRGSRSDLSDILDEDYWNDFDATVEGVARETE